MSGFCPDCGADIEGVRFCPECGREIDSTAPTQAIGSEETEGSTEGWRSYLPTSWRIGVAGGVIGLIAGGLVAWGLANIGGATGGFVLGWILVSFYVWQKPTAIGALGSGLYICALLLVLVPLFFYGPLLTGGEDPETAEEVGMAIGGILGLVIWTFVFGVVAVVVGAIGYTLKRRETKQLT